MQKKSKNIHRSGLPTILIVSGGLLQIPAIIQAKELGMITAVSDLNPNAPAMKYADIRLNLDTWDIQGHIREAKKLAQTHNLVGVYTQGADVEATVAETAKALNLPGTSTEAAWNCKNKARMRKVFVQKGMNKVDFEEVDNEKDGLIAAKRIGFPIIVKNLDNSASRGTTVVYKESELGEAIEKAKAASKTKTALIEKFLTGTEHSVDMIVFNGRYYPAGICDRPFSPPPFRIELGHINPTNLTREQQSKIYKLTEESGLALGIDFGVAKADIIYTEKGPIILEMTNRLSGGFDSQYTKPAATGLNLIRPTMKMALGGKPDFNDLKVKLHRHSACLALFPKPGKIISIKGTEEALKMPEILNVILNAKVGDQVKDAQASADRIGFVIGVGDTRAKAINSVNKAIKKISIETE